MRTSNVKTAIYRSLFFGLAVCVQAEQAPPLELPESEIYLFDLRLEKGELLLLEGRNISQHPGYDNQPFFTAKSESILFSSQRDPRQTDVYEYFLRHGKTVQVTRTPEQEYSPKASPDNRTVTFVREGGNPKQSLWQMNRKSGDISWALKSLEPIGYYAWNHNSGDILLWIRYAFSMQHMNPAKTLSEFVIGNALATSPQRIPNSNEFSFVHRQMNEEVWIKVFNPENRTIRPLTPVVADGSRDYIWTPSGDILMGNNTTLYRWQPSVESGWQVLAELGEHGITRITRLAVSPDGGKLALVDNPKQQ